MNDLILKLMRTMYFRFLFREEDESYKETGSSKPRNTEFMNKVYFHATGLFRGLVRLVLAARTRDKLLIWLFKKQFNSRKSFSQASPGGIAQPNTQLDLGINIIGFLRGELGIGEASRSSIRAAQAAGISVMGYEYNWIIGSRILEEMPAVPTSGVAHRINLFHINADIFSTTFVLLGPRFFDGRFNISYWMWETTDIPDDRVATSVFLDEIWTPSQFCRDVIASKVGIPVEVMPLNVEPEIEVNTGRKELGLPEVGFLFLCVADFYSVAERKNPLAVLEAFKRAFGRKPNNIHLVLKINNSLHRPDIMNIIKQYEEEISSMMIINSYLDRPRFNALTNCCDCLVSLHRSEGFGLTLAEAMYMGKPVVATGWSGNMDFMSAENSVPIKYKLIELEKDFPPYREGSSWADPDIDHAAEAMLHVSSDPQFALSIGSRAREDIRTKFSPRSTGAVMRHRLTTICH